MNTHKSYLAAIRFGLGETTGRQVAPEHWLSEQVSSMTAPSRSLRGMDNADDIIREYVRGSKPKTEAARDERRQQLRDIYTKEMQARITEQRTTKRPFHERLVAFWSNHFTISITKPDLRGLVGAFEREAIRPNITGSFHELLEAATQHPAMLLYLDNARSIGPNSENGRNNRRGLNENHARELLELHTLGVDGGYEQTDVESLAKLLTGWGVSSTGYTFDARNHEPGEVALLGYAYPDLGERRGKAALRDLSRHPSTAKHIATKLCQHFLADDPSLEAINRIQQLFIKTDGDLAVVSAGLIDEPEAWEPFHKYKTPYELVISALRVIPAADSDVLQHIRYLGQSPFSANSPAGWPDRQSDWLTPGAVGARLEWAQTFGKKYNHKVNALKLADSMFGPLLSSQTRHAIQSSSNPLGLLLASPEFQWR